LHQALFDEQGRAPPSMSYWGFQVAAVRAFCGGKTESDYADEIVWIKD
jgi:hypothetical protein